MAEPSFRLLTSRSDDPPGAQRVLATAATSGPWFPDAQHMGPPSALLVRALERCGLSGHLRDPGPAQVWGRLLVPIVEDEEPTPWQRLASFAESTNGAGASLDLNQWLFVNTDLTLHLHRAPHGEWIGLDADSEIGPDGAGTAFARLHDQHGPIGRAALALTVRPR